MLARCPWLAAFAFSALPAAAQQGVSFQNARFLDSFGQLTSLTTGVVLDATTAGHWIAEFDFTSPLLDPVSGQYRLQPMAVLWTLTDDESQLAPSHAPGGWQGVSDPASEPIVQSFDRATGSGTAQVSIPIATGLGSGRRHPGWAAGAVLLEVVVGWRGDLGVDGQGELQSPQFVGQAVVDAEAPQRWIDIEAPLVGIPAEFSVHVLSPHDIQVERTFQIHNPCPHVVRFSDAPEEDAVTVILPAGESMGTVRMRGIGSGDYHLVLVDSSAVQMDLSNRCTVDVAQFVSGADLATFDFGDDDGGLLQGTSSNVIMHAPGWTPGQTVHVQAPGGPSGPFLNKKCKPPSDGSSSAGQTPTVCSECGTSPELSCGESATFASPGTCVWKLWSTCTKGGSTTISAPTYTKVKGPYDTSLGCPYKGGSIKYDPWTITGGTQTYKKCCDYKQTSGSTNVSLPNCS